ncbi:hypothetical protein DFQ30_008567 [Apophysomyces sp. BC1015]|nr:hypothetical protein DFQ30_008567 [Apophysomyces sp. BC1015]
MEPSNSSDAQNGIKEESIERSKESTTLSAVNSKDNVESIKGRIIATHKLLKYLETTKAEAETEKTRTIKLNETVTQLKSEKTALEQKLNAAHVLLEESNRQHVKVNVEELNRHAANLEKELKDTIEAKTRAESLTSSSQMYIKQLEAQIEDMRRKFKTFEADNRKRQADNQEKTHKSAEKKDQEIFELQTKISKLEKDIQELHDTNETLENDEMELRINYDMQQTTIDEMKVELDRSKNELEQARSDVIMYKQELAQHTQTDKNRVDTFSDDLKKELEKRTEEVQQLTGEVARLKAHSADETHARQEYSQMEEELIRLRQRVAQQHQVENTVTIPTTYSGGQDYAIAIMELRRAVFENDQLRKEKRVLQDKYTEQLVIYADSENRRKASTLARLLPDYRPEMTDNICSASFLHDDRNAQIRRSSVARSVESFHDYDDISPTLDPTSSNETHSTHSSQGKATNIVRALSPLSKQKRPSLPSSVLDINRSQTSPTASTSTLSTKRSMTQALPIPPESNGKARYRSSDMIVPESQVLPSTGTTRPKGRLSKLEKVAKARLPSSMNVPSRKRAVDQQNTSTEAPKKQRKTAKSVADIAASFPPIVNHITLIKTRIEEFSRDTPQGILEKLSDMEVFATWKIDVMLGSLEGFYHSMKSYSNPLTKSDGLVPDRHDYGIPDGIELDCPCCIDQREKNMAWFLWTLSSTYPVENAYAKIVSWAAKQAVANVQNSNIVLACRYTRLISLLCRKGDDSQRLRIFCYDVVRLSPPNANFVAPLFNIALIWSDILSENSNASKDRDLILKSMQCGVASYCRQENSNESAKTFYATLVEACSWPAMEEVPSLETNIEKLTSMLSLPDLKSLYEADSGTYAELRFNLIRAFELSFWRLNNWKATYDDFILKVLWPLLNDDVLADFVLELIGLLGRCGMARDEKSKDKSGVNELRSRLVGVLQLGNDCPEEEFTLQMTAAQAFTNLAPSDRAVKLSPLLRWFEGLKPEFEKRLTNELRETYTKMRNSSNAMHLT